MLLQWSGRPAQISRWFEQDPWLTAVTTSPLADVAEDVKGFTISVELPGVKAEDLKIDLDGARLVISGEKRQETAEQTDRVHRVERRFGAFRRVFALPESVDREGIGARLADGVLTVTLPKVAKAQPRTIPVAATN